MSSRPQFVLAAMLTVLLAACRSGNDPLVIHVFRDPAAPSAALLSRRIEYFRSLHVRTPSRRLIVVNEIAADYRSTLGDLGDSSAPELVILNSEREGQNNPRLREELTHAIDLCSDGQRCLAFIPSWVSGEQRTAAQMLLNSLLTD